QRGGMEGAGVKHRRTRMMSLTRKRARLFGAFVLLVLAASPLKFQASVSTAHSADTAAAVAAAAPVPVGCPPSTTTWSVKTGTDGGATVPRSPVGTTSVADLTTRANQGSGVRYSPATVFSVTAQIDSESFEHDNDYHIAISDHVTPTPAPTPTPVPTPTATPTAGPTPTATPTPPPPPYPYQMIV